MAGRGRRQRDRGRVDRARAGERSRCRTRSSPTTSPRSPGGAHGEPGARWSRSTGPSGSGKSTVARGVAAALGLTSLDTGAMYRAVTLAALEAGRRPRRRRRASRRWRARRASTSTTVAIDARRPRRERRDPRPARSPARCRRCRRIPRCARSSSPASGRGSREHGGGVVEGRDIGTVVFPDAPVKVFLTASDDERAAPPAARRGGRGATRRRRRRPARRSTAATGPTRPLGRALRPRGRRAPTPSSSTPPTVAADDVVAEIVAPGRAADGAMTFYRFARGVVLEPVQGACSGCGWSGRSTCPTTGAYIVAPSHRSILDIPFAAFITRRTVRFMAKETLFSTALGRRLFDRARRGPGRAGHGRPCRAAGARGRARGGRAAGGVPGGHPRERARDRRAVRRAPRTSPSSSACRSCRSASAAASRSCPRASCFPRLHRVAVVGRAARSSRRCVDGRAAACRGDQADRGAASRAPARLRRGRAGSARLTQARQPASTLDASTRRSSVNALGPHRRAPHRRTGPGRRRRGPASARAAPAAAGSTRPRR